MSKKIIFFWLLNISLIFFLYNLSLKLYFFQDDFFLFKISLAKDIKSLLNFFISRSDVIFYRPLSMQLFYFLGRKIFGLNAFFYHLFGLSLHLLNVYLIYLLIYKISKIRLLAKLSAFFYGTSGIHFMALSWIAAFHFFFGANFFLLSFIFFIKSLEKPKKLFIYIAFLLFIGALLSDELAICLPFILILYCLFFLKLKNKWFFKIRSLCLLYFITIIFYIFYRLVVIPIHFKDTYSMHLDLRAVKNIFWYILWGLNIPEEFKYQMISFFKINPKFVNDFFSTNKLVWQLFTVNIFLIYIFPLIIMLFGKSFKSKRKMYFKTSLFGLSWFLFCLIPVIFFPFHQYPYFLTIASVGFYIFFLTPITFLFNSYRVRTDIFLIFMLITGSCWYIASLVNIRFTEKIHWIVPRANLSRIYIAKIKSQFPKLPPESTLVLPKNKVLQHALMNSEAAFIIYNDLSIKLAYGDFPVPKMCEAIMTKKKYSLEELPAIQLLYNQCLKDNNIYFLNNK